MSIVLSPTIYHYLLAEQFVTTVLLSVTASVTAPPRPVRCHALAILGGKMLDSEFDHGVPLSAISASPNQSFDSGIYDEYQYRDRTAFDSIMDTRRSMTRDSLMDGSSEKLSRVDSVFFENSRVSSEGYSVQSQFRPVSIISTDSSHYAPREDDTMISVGVRISYFEQCLISPIDAWWWTCPSCFYGFTDAAVPVRTSREERW